jgi:hypothetical protein
MSSKAREALEKCDALLKRITKSAWFIETRMGLTKETMDVVNAITEAISEPLRNCDVGTVEEQEERFDVFCSRGKCDNCPLEKEGVWSNCVIRWSQMPYESEVK